MGHVFVAYQSEDGAFVAELIQQLEGAGVVAWADNERLRTGEGWREGTDQAIRDAFAVLVMLSPTAVTSQQIAYEAIFALGAGIDVLVLTQGDVKVPPRLESLVRLDFTPDVSPPWGRLIRLLQDAQNRGERRPFPFRPARLGESQRSPVFSRRPGSFGRSDGDPVDEMFDSIKSNERPGIESLLKALESDNRDKRAMAASRLGEIGERSAIPALLRLLHDEDWRVREEAARALGSLKAAAAVVGLLECIRTGRPGPFGGSTSIFSDAIKAIGAPAVPVLVDALSDEEPRIRLAIIDLLGESGEPEVAPALVGALRDPEWRVRWQAAETLGKLRNSTAVPELLDMLGDSSKDVRIAVAYALGRIKQPSAVAGLVKLLNDREWRVRWGAAEALWEIGEEAVPALIQTLDNEDDYVRRAAARALAQIGPAAVPSLVAALQHDNWDVRWSAAAALQDIGDPAVAALVAALDGDNWQATWAAADTLKRIGTKETMLAVEKWRKGREDNESNALPYLHGGSAEVEPNYPAPAADDEPGER